MSTYTVTYTIVPMNVSTARMNAIWAAVPLDTTTEAELGLVLNSDTVDFGSPMNRTLQYHDNGTGPIAPGPPLAAVLANYYTRYFGLALRTSVVASPVVVTA